MSPEEVIKKAEAIINGKNCEKKALQLCMNAGICVNCGEPTIEKEIYITDMADWFESLHICYKCNIAIHEDDGDATELISPIPNNFTLEAVEKSNKSLLNKFLNIFK